MLSASTARLVEGAASLAEPELVQIKGADKPVAAQRLLGMEERPRLIERVESNLVGRRWEMFAVEALLDRAIEGHGGVVGVVGPPGIGKSRLVREVSAMASRRGVEVFTGFCGRTPARSLSMPWRACLRSHRRRCSGRAGGRRSSARPDSWGRAGKMCCCLTTCSASPIPRRRFRGSIRMLVEDG